MRSRHLQAVLLVAVLAAAGPATGSTPDLPPEIQFDLLVQQLTSEIEQERWEPALETIEALENGPFEPPSSLLHFAGKANLYAGNPNEAERSWLEYLRIEGREGRYYAEALAGVVEARSTDAYVSLAEGEFIDCGGCPAMVTIPSGTVASTGTDGRVREIAVERPFAIGKHEVTFDQYARFVAASGHGSSRNCKVYIRMESGDRLVMEPRSNRSWRDSSPRVFDQQPVSCVSWHDAQAYAAWLTEETGHVYRLPTADEWEYAARAGAETPWTCGDDPGCIDSASWNRGNRRGPHAEAVGTRAPNAWGMHDVHGNLWEWVEDCGWPVEECKRRLILGGSWAQLAELLRLERRGSGASADSVDALIGFRVLREMP